LHPSRVLNSTRCTLDPHPHFQNLKSLSPDLKLKTPNPKLIIKSPKPFSLKPYTLDPNTKP